MKTTIALWVASFVIVEGIRWAIGIDKAANEIQVISAIPWIPIIWHQYQVHKRHKRIESHLEKLRGDEK